MNKPLKYLSIVCLSLPLVACWTTKSGQKSGIIVKVAKEGKYWGTYEGEMIKGGLDNASGASGKSFLFTIGQFDSKLVKKARLAMQNNEHVVLNYHCEEFVAPWRGESECFADDIQILKK
jgi:hypothetical protein